MTQSPHGGPAAPLTPEYDPGVGASGFDYGAPQPAAGSEAWGSSAAPAGSGGGYGLGTPPAPTWAPSGPGAPAHADAPTASVPPVTDAVPPELGGPAGLTPEAGASRSTRAGRARGPRRARLQLRHVNPWTVLKFSCVLSIALFFVWLIVVGVLFGVLDGAGVIQKINNAYTTIQGGNAKAPVTAGVVFGGAAIIGVVNIVLFVALSTVGSVVYNLCADLVGGIEITLSER